ncbi:hypothetical protein [Furfurilactobacillus cerevisiae]|uniref:hypothetical protein n=1 Tax=Furfurilactobacillus rossiae TaxID=231049 RepID=UPI003B980D74
MLDTDGRTYYANQSGQLSTGWQTTNNNSYYFDPTTYTADIGMNKIDNKGYYFDKSGRMQTGLFTGQDGQIYYATKDGQLQTGWQSLNGNTYYFDPQSYFAYAGTKELSLDIKRYYFDNSGKLLGWFITQGGELYDYNKDGTRQTGWQTINGDTYYFDLNRFYAYVGNYTLPIDGTKYYFDITGKLLVDCKINPNAVRTKKISFL